MDRHTRYQGLIIQDHQVLLIRHREHATGASYWVVPGGGKEPGETEQECIVREMQEETNLVVAVDRLLYSEPVSAAGVYRWRKSYLCHPVSGSAAPGYEPEPEAAEWYAISEVRWFDLRDESGWPPDLISDSITYPQIVRLQKEFG